MIVFRITWRAGKFSGRPCCLDQSVSDRLVASTWFRYRANQLRKAPVVTLGPIGAFQDRVRAGETEGMSTALVNDEVWVLAALLLSPGR